MKKAVVIFNSRTGTTEKYAKNIGNYIKEKGIEVQISSAQGVKYQQEIFDNADYIFLGCWTSGLMIILQHPEKAWIEFAKTLPKMENAKLALFTTYKILTGSMFRKMMKELDVKFDKSSLELKSRTGLLSDDDKLSIDKFIEELNLIIKTFA